MSLRRTLRTVLGCSLLAVACGSSDDPGTESSEPLDPPSNIDAVSCWEIVSSESVSSDCSDCCDANAFTRSTLYDDHCVCGNQRDDSGATACADQTASADVCSSCCRSAGFSGHGWVGGSSSGCTCFGKSDAEVCAGTLQAGDPSAACRTCCLDDGYLSYAYIGIGERECSCIDF